MRQSVVRGRYTLVCMVEESFARPRVVVSRCLGFEACRYNGQMIPDDFADRLSRFVDFLPVCPEVEIGLGTPRDPIRLQSTTSDLARLRLVQTSTSRDLSSLMNGFSEKFLSSLDAVDGFILKASSPSCAVKDAKRFSEAPDSPALGRGPGMFAQAVLTRFPSLPIEDEGRLRNLAIREHFLTRLFLQAAFREFRRTPSRAGLVRWQSRLKLLLMAHSQPLMRRLGRIVSELKGRRIEEAAAEFAEVLSQALSHRPRAGTHINVLQHAFGYVSQRLAGRERRYFLDALEQFRDGRIPLSTPAGILRAWLLRFEVDYLLEQVYFQPFPEELIDLSDSGRGRRPA